MERPRESGGFILKLMRTLGVIEISFEIVFCYFENEIRSVYFPYLVSNLKGRGIEQLFKPVTPVGYLIFSNCEFDLIAKF